MPNNNPHGHNQYTKSEYRSSRGQSAGAGSTEATNATSASYATGATGAAGAGATQTPGAQAPSGTSRRGFASMDEQTQREIASKGGHSQGRDNNPGNFANDREKAREAGRKGGEAHGSNR
jgi:hypothetical protein